MATRRKVRAAAIRWDSLSDRIRRIADLVKSEEDATDQWLSAEAVIESFLEAAIARSIDLPSGIEVGEACLCLLVILAADPNGDGLRLCGELLESSAVVSLLSLEPRVKSFLQAALVELERQARLLEPTPLELDIF